MEFFKKQILKNQKGFTLAELMIVVAIIGIMTSVSLLMFNKNRSQKEVETGARLLSATISQAYNNAITGKMYKVGGVDKNACVYGVKGSGGLLGMISFASYIAPANTSCTQPGNPVSEITTNIQGVKADAFDINYALPFGKPYFNGAEQINSAKIRVYSVRDNSIAYAICAFPSGRVYEKGCTTANCSDVTCN
jgi:prepilin-type N-terminal cleavage/methylation domain-containing protein